MGCLPNTPLVHEDQRLTHFAKELQNKINKHLCDPGGVLDVQFTNVLFVDQNDPGPTPPAPAGTRNYWTDKFSTIQDAVNAAQDGDVIWINPGTYTEDLDLSDVADNVTLVGTGAHSTIIENATDTFTIQCQPTATIAGFRLKNLSIVNNNGNQAVFVDATNAPDSFTELGNLYIEDCFILSSMEQGHAVDLRYVNQAAIIHMWILETVAGGGFSLINCSAVECIDSFVGEEVNANYDTADPVQPSSGKDGYRFFNLIAKGDVTLSNQVNIDINEGSVIEGDLQGTIVQTSNDEDDAPFIKCHGQVFGVNLSFDSDGEYTGRLIANFDHAEFLGGFVFNSAVGNATAEWRVRARNAVFAPDNEITCDIEVGAAGRGFFDILGSEFKQSDLNVDSYGVDRTFHYIEAAEMSQGDNIIDIEPPYSNLIEATTAYTIHPEQVGPPAVGYPGTAYHTKSPSGFVCSCEAAGDQFAFKLIMHIFTDPV